MAAPASKRGGPASTTAPPAAGGDSVAHERWCWILVALVGQPVTATLKDGVRVTGILAAATPDAGDLSIALRQAVTILPATETAAAAAVAPPKPALVLNGKDLVQLEAQDTDIEFVGHAALPPQRPHSSASSTPAAATDSFRTDTDISRASQLGKERQLQAWGAEAGYGGGGIEDGDAGGGLEDGLGRSVNGNGKGNNTGRRGGGGGGPGSSSNGGGGAWDQFAANERAFGLRTDYNDEIYTTRLDRSTADFKQREARAAQLEREILKGSSTSSTSLAHNAHVAEERGEQVADSLDEEERYGAVIRTGTEGAYVPPGARKAALARLQQQNGGQGQGSPAGAGSGSSGTASPAAPPPASSLSASTPAAAAPASPAPATSTTTTTTTKPNPNAKPYDRSMQEFVHSERVRLEQRRAQMQQAQQQSQQQAQLKKEHDSKLASLVQWSQTFKNPYPMPDEVAQILGKKPVTGGATTTSTSTAESKTTAAKSATVSPATATTALPATSAATVTPPKASAAATGKPIAPTTTTKITKAMVLEIPPFDPNRAKAKQAALLAAQKAGTAPAAPAAAAAAATAPAASASGTAGTTAPSTSTEAKPPAGGAKKLSATSAAFVFKPNPAAASFTPGASNTVTATATAAGAGAASARRPSATSTTASAAESAPAPKVPVNPFFGTKQIKKGSSSMHVKEDFTPFKNGVPPEPSTVPPAWPFTGKPYRSIYPIPPQGPLDDGAATSGMIDPNNVAAIAAAQQQQAHVHATHAFIGGVPINMLPGPQHPPPPQQQQQQQQQQPFVAISSAGGSISGSPAPMPMPPPLPPQPIAGGGPHLQHLHPHQQPHQQQFGMYGGGGGGGGGHGAAPPPLGPPQHHHQFAQQQFSPAAAAAAAVAAAAMGYARQPGGASGGGPPPPPPQQQQQQQQHMAHMNAPGPGPQFQPHHGQQQPPHHPPFFGQPGGGGGPAGAGGGGSHMLGFVPGPNQGHPPHGPQMLSSPHLPHAAVHSPRMSVSTQGGRGPPQQQQQQPPMPWTPPPFQQSGTPIPNGGPPPPPPHVQGGPGGLPPPQ